MVSCALAACRGSDSAAHIPCTPVSWRAQSVPCVPPPIPARCTPISHLQQPDARGWAQTCPAAHTRTPRLAWRGAPFSGLKTCVEMCSAQSDQLMLVPDAVEHSEFLL